MTFSNKLSKTSGVVDLLTSPHQTFSANPGSSMMNRSFGERPVRSPVVASKTPCAVRQASPRSTASPCNASQPRFQWTAPLGFNPCVVNGVANSEGPVPLEVISMATDCATRFQLLRLVELIGYLKIFNKKTKFHRCN